ncbi:MAG TPA: hypothetical protein VKT28_15755 [Puia sp.]|nr:hypothetical protein [Puia sp.]
MTNLKKVFLPVASVALLFSCHQQHKKIVSTDFVDSLITHYSPSSLSIENQKEKQFWKSRIDPKLAGYVNESRYAGCLGLDFHLSGDIDSLKKSDSVLQKINNNFNHREASVQLALASHCVTEHRFMQADSFLQKAKLLGLRPYESNTSSFDVDFELGRYADAKAALNAMSSPNDYGYNFRKSKMEHLNGALDSSIATMQHAAKAANDNTYLKDIALANAADLCIHAGDLQKANELYMECIALNSDDFHSIMGIGWIALVHDHNDSLAAKIFKFVLSKNKLPDALFKLTQVAANMNDSSFQIKYAKAFEEKASAIVYDRMYNKYLLQLYTGILQKPERAEDITKDELNNRATPQTYAWYAWALFCNNKKEEAYKIFEKYVSGKPLEGLELYWMGMMMDGLDKKYNAIEFFKAAYKNKYDLDPSFRKTIETRLSL